MVVVQPRALASSVNDSGRVTGRGLLHTNVPRAGARSSRPSATRASIAWRTVIRATPKCCISPRSEGAGAPSGRSCDQAADVLPHLDVLERRTERHEHLIHGRGV